jgi:hypothetical protein
MIMLQGTESSHIYYLEKKTVYKYKGSVLKHLLSNTKHHKCTAQVHNLNIVICIVLNYNNSRKIFSSTNPRYSNKVMLQEYAQVSVSQCEIQRRQKNGRTLCTTVVCPCMYSAPNYYHYNTEPALQWLYTLPGIKAGAELDAPWCTCINLTSTHWQSDIGLEDFLVDHKMVEPSTGEDQ